MPGFRSITAIEDQIALTMPSMDRGGSGVPGMTYEQGVQAALTWATGESDEAPMDGVDEPGT